MSLAFDFERSPNSWIGLTSHALDQAMNRELAATGLTLRQVQVLASLQLTGERTQVALARDLGIEPSTLVRVLDRMQRDGWIERRSDPEDRRRKRIRATTKATTNWPLLTALGRRVQARTVEGLSLGELAQLRELLERVRSNLVRRSSVLHSMRDLP